MDLRVCNKLTGSKMFCFVKKYYKIEKEDAQMTSCASEEFPLTTAVVSCRICAHAVMMMEFVSLNWKI